ncbi:MAG: DUF6273 domain-containing protein [Defluviitaleaceae bacterium]|nr:DUF6273 domain-containing protein [Defluviitaleaceae bacterium]
MNPSQNNPTMPCPICRQQAELNTPYTYEFENKVFATKEDASNRLNPSAKPHKRYYKMQQSYSRLQRNHVRLHAEYQETKKYINNQNNEMEKLKKQIHQLNAEHQKTKKQITTILKQLDKKPKENSHRLQAPQIGSLIPFAGYIWQVLDIQNGQVLLLSELVIEKRVYHKDREDITWENCSLRHYLNNNFYNKLSAAEKRRVVQRTITNHDNPWLGIKGGSKTTDNVFLLSIDELVHYFCDSEQLKNGKLNENPGDDHVIDDQFNKKRIAKDIGGRAGWWWLRSPGYVSSGAASVNNDGLVRLSGNYVNNVSGGVRPALWLNL